MPEQGTKATIFSAGLRTAGDAAVAGRLALGHRRGVAVTAGVAAAAAVGAGQRLAHRSLLGIDFHVEDLGGQRQQAAEDAAQNAEELYPYVRNMVFKNFGRNLRYN